MFARAVSACLSAFRTLRLNPLSLVKSLTLFSLFAFSITHLQAQQTSTTALVATVSGAPATTVSQGTMVTLTATVDHGASAVSLGRVAFCDAGFPHCTDIHRLGTAQLTAGGTAVFRFAPAVGNHNYFAIFEGTSGFATSISSNVTLTVTGPSPTSTTVSSNGAIGAYTLTAVVASSIQPPSPTGNVSFFDVTAGGVLLATAPLGTPTIGQLNFPSLTSPGFSGVGMAAGDFNNDGIPDLVTIDNAGNLTVGVGNGDNTFHSLTPVKLFSYTYIVKIATADFNSDGNLDLAVVGGSNNVTILLGHGDGTFSVASTPSTDQVPTDMAIADWNADGIPDLAITNFEDNHVTILLGQGDGTFTATVTSPTTNAGPGHIANGDFNGDGKPDFIVVTLTDYKATVFLGNGDGTFNAVAPAAASGFDTDSIVVGDFNGDGKADFAMNIFTDVYTYLGNGDGTFAAGIHTSITPSGNIPSALTVADFNGDGVADIAFTSDNSNSTFGPTVLVGKGDGTFTQTGPFSGLYSNTLAAADFNGDGYPDLAFLSGYNGIVPVAILLAQNPSTATATASNISLTGVGTHQVEATYLGDANFSGSTSATVSLVARTVPPVLALTIAPTASNYGQQVVLTATLAPFTVLNQSTNGESVIFFNGANSLGSATLSSGTASLSVTSLPTGTDTITATYAGDANLLSASSAAVPFTVSQNTPVLHWNGPLTLTYGTALSSSVLNVTSSTPGTFVYTPALGVVLQPGTQTVSVAFTPADTVDYVPTTSTNTITVTPATLIVTAANVSRSYGSANPTLPVSLVGLVGSDAITTSATSTATISSPAGIYPIIPTAAGADISKYVVTPVNGVLTVTQASTTTTTTSSAASIVVGTPVTFTASVAPGTTGTPTGSVAFMNGTVTLATVPLTGATATYTTSPPSVGSYSVTASYLGDSNFKGSVSPAFNQIITGVPDFAFSSAATTMSIQRGQSGTLALTVTPTNGYNQPTTFSCTGLPSYATCSFSPTSVTPNGSAITTQLNVATTAATASLHSPLNKMTGWGEGTSVALGLLLFLSPATRRVRCGKPSRLLVLLLGVLVVQLSGCSSSTNSNSGSTTQSSQISIIASSGTGTAVTQHTIALTITTTN